MLDPVVAVEHRHREQDRAELPDAEEDRRRLGRRGEHHRDTVAARRHRAPRACARHWLARSCSSPQTSSRSGRRSSPRSSPACRAGACRRRRRRCCSAPEPPSVGGAPAPRSSARSCWAPRRHRTSRRDARRIIARRSRASRLDRLQAIQGFPAADSGSPPMLPHDAGGRRPRCGPRRAPQPARRKGSPRHVRRRRRLSRAPDADRASLYRGWSGAARLLPSCPATCGSRRRGLRPAPLDLLSTRGRGRGSRTGPRRAVGDPRSTRGAMSFRRTAATSTSSSWRSSSVWRSSPAASRALLPSRGGCGNRQASRQEAGGGASATSLDVRGGRLVVAAGSRQRRQPCASSSPSSTAAGRRAMLRPRGQSSTTSSRVRARRRRHRGRRARCGVSSAQRGAHLRRLRRRDAHNVVRASFRWLACSWDGLSSSAAPSSTDDLHRHGREVARLRRAEGNRRSGVYVYRIVVPQSLIIGVLGSRAGAGAVVVATDWSAARAGVRHRPALDRRGPRLRRRASLAVLASWRAGAAHQQHRPGDGVPRMTNAEPVLRVEELTRVFASGRTSCAPSTASAWRRTRARSCSSWGRPAPARRRC